MWVYWVKMLSSICGCQLLKGAIASLNDLVVDVVKGCEVPVGPKDMSLEAL